MIRQTKIELLKGERLYRIHDDLDGKSRGFYYATTEGRIIKMYKNGAKKVMMQYRSKRVLHVKIHGREKNAARLIYETIVGPVPEGMVLVHRNTITSDNSIVNLMPVTRSEVGRLHGARARSKEVYCEDNDCYYRSAREAGRQLHCSYQTILDICNKKVKRSPLVNVRWSGPGRRK